mgnify:CR=1 FL=1
MVARLCNPFLDTSCARNPTNRKDRAVFDIRRDSNNPDTSHGVRKRRHNLGDVPGIKLSLVFDPDTLGPVAAKLFDLSKFKTVKWAEKSMGMSTTFQWRTQEVELARALLVAIFLAGSFLSLEQRRGGV